MKKFLALNFTFCLLILLVLILFKPFSKAANNANKNSPLAKISSSPEGIRPNILESTTSPAVVPPSAQIELDILGPASFQSWPSSWEKKADDKTQYMMRYLRNTLMYSTNMIDINGDGLIDILYRDQAPECLNCDERYGIWLNKGNLQFDLVYKCVVRAEPTGQPQPEPDSDYKWYGDCAAV